MEFTIAWRLQRKTLHQLRMTLERSFPTSCCCLHVHWKMKLLQLVLLAWLLPWKTCRSLPLRPYFAWCETRKQQSLSFRFLNTSGHCACGADLMWRDMWPDLAARIGQKHMNLQNELLQLFKLCLTQGRHALEKSTWTRWHTGKSQGYSTFYSFALEWSGVIQLCKLPNAYLFITYCVNFQRLL